MKSRSLLASLLFTACAALAAAATDYEIRFDRVSTVGEKYHVVATGTDEQTMNASIDGVPAQNRSEKLAFELSADCEVLAVTSKGRESQLKLTVVKFMRTDATQPGELLPPGSVIVADVNGARTKFTVGGEPASRIVARALDTLGVNVRSDEKVSEDTIFGTTERKKVGDTWPINTEAAASEIAKTGMPVDKTNLSGTATLLEATSANGQPVLRVSATTEIKGLKPQLPPGVEVKKAELKAEFSGLFPVDTSKPRPQESQTMSMEVAAGGERDGKIMEMTMTKKTTRETKFTRN